MSIRSTKPRTLVVAAAGCAIALTSALGPGCKPKRENIAEARKAEAAKRAAQVQATVTDKTAAKRMAAGGLDPAAIPAGEAGKVVAVVGDRRITVGEVAQRIAEEPPHMQARYATLDNRKALLERMVQFELLVTEALDRKLDQSPRVRAAYKQALALELMQTVGKGTLSEVTEADVKAYFDANKAEFLKPELRRASLMVLGTKKHAEELRVKIQAAIADSPLRARQVFGDWVMKRSVDKATRIVKGDLGMFDLAGTPEQRRLPPPKSVLPVVFALDKIGDVSEPTELSDGKYGLIQLTGMRPGVQQSLDDVRMAIRGKLLKQRTIAAREKFLDDLMKKTSVTIDEKVLATVEQPKPEQGKASKAGPPKNVPLPNNTSALRRHVKGRLKMSGAPVKLEGPASGKAMTKRPVSLPPGEVQKRVQEYRKKVERKKHEQETLQSGGMPE